MAGNNPQGVFVSVDVNLKWGGTTHIGMVRAQNQDALYTDSQLFVVADGLGGPGNGDIASQMTVKVVAERSPSTRDELVAAIEEANYAVHRRSVEDEELMGMATTVCALAVIDGGEDHQLSLANVGDSRAYRHHGHELEMLTLDHSQVAEMVRLGMLEPHEAEHHERRNTLTRAVGVLPEVTVDDWILDIRGGERFLLCSDGITNMLTDEEIALMLSHVPDANEAAQHLVAAANANGGTDNATAVVVDVHLTRTMIGADGNPVSITEQPTAMTHSSSSHGPGGWWQRKRAARQAKRAG